MDKANQPTTEELKAIFKSKELQDIRSSQDETYIEKIRKINRITMEEEEAKTRDLPEDPANHRSKLPAYYTNPEVKEKSLGTQIKECFMIPGSGLIVILEDKFEYKGKVLLPKTTERKGTTGVILKVGDGLIRTFNGNILKQGDRIAYGTWTGTQFSFEGRPAYRVLGEMEVTCIITDAATELLNVEA